MKKYGNISVAVICMMIVMLPMFFLAMYEKDGQSLEVIAHHFIETKFMRPKIRPFKTNNYYELLEKQEKVEKEVMEIVKNSQKKKARKN